MEAGRELDALIYEKIFGKRRPQEGEKWDGMTHFFNYMHGDWRAWDGTPIPHFSTDIAAAWQVVEKLQTMKNVGLLIKAYPLEYGGRFVASVPGTQIQGEGETMPLAVCRVALKIVEE